jgi:hypothetical protein
MGEMKRFNVYITEKKGGASAGKLEVVTTSLEVAREYTLSKFPTLDKDIPDFDNNYVLVQKLAYKGSTKRKDMPVITSKDIDKFQKRLSKGKLDIIKPFSKDTSPNNPFPEGLFGDNADKFLEAGLKKNDGDEIDDVVKVTRDKISAKDLIPIQDQIYFDKGIGTIIKNGVDGTIKLLNSKVLIVSSDNRIIDGHHRFLSAILLDRNMKLNVLKINLPLSKLLPLAIAYGDAIGNKRNK